MRIYICWYAFFLSWGGAEGILAIFPILYLPFPAQKYIVWFWRYWRRRLKCFRSCSSYWLMLDQFISTGCSLHIIFFLKLLWFLWSRPVLSVIDLSSSGPSVKFAVPEISGWTHTHTHWQRNLMESGIFFKIFIVDDQGFVSRSESSVFACRSGSGFQGWILIRNWFVLRGWNWIRIWSILNRIRNPVVNHQQRYF